MRKKKPISSWELNGSLLKSLNPLHQGAFWQVWLKLAQLLWRRKFLKLSMYFWYLLIISPYYTPRKRSFGGYIVILMFKVVWTNMNPLLQGCFVSSLVEIGTVVLEKKILNFINVFSLFRYYLPLGKDMTLHMNKIEFPSPKYASRQVWLKLATRFWRIRFLNFFYVFLLFDSPWKWTWHFNCTIFTSSFHQRILCAKFGYNWPSGSGEEDF